MCECKSADVNNVSSVHCALLPPLCYQLFCRALVCAPMSLLSMQREYLNSANRSPVANGCSKAAAEVEAEMNDGRQCLCDGDDWRYDGGNGRAHVGAALDDIIAEVCSRAALFSQLQLSLHACMHIFFVLSLELLLVSVCVAGYSSGDCHDVRLLALRLRRCCLTLLREYLHVCVRLLVGRWRVS